MQIYEENLAYFKNRLPELYSSIVNYSGPQYRTLPTRNGQLTLIYPKDGQEYFIHSKYDPGSEAEKLVKNLDLGADHIIVFGMGLGYHIELILKRKNPMSRILVVEPEIGVFIESLKVIRWKSHFESGNFFIFVGHNLHLLAEQVLDFVHFASFDNLKMIDFPSEVRLMSVFFTRAKTTVNNEIKTLLYDFQTRLAENSMVGKNILKNLPLLLKTRPVQSLTNRFRGQPGFIISAGPSLDYNILFLKKINNRGIIVSVDTALKPLLKKGIQPHFTVVVDPSYKNYLHLHGTEKIIQNFLISETGIAHQVYLDFQDKIFCSSLGKPLVKMVEEKIGEIGEIPAWGSVISLALNFAVFLGLNPVIFVGQDFAFTGMRNHCRGTSWEDSWLEYSQQLDVMQRQEKQSIDGISQTIRQTDVYDNETLTSDKLMLYKNYLLRMLNNAPETQFINASAGGILKEIPHLDIQQVLERYIYPNPPIDISSISDIPPIVNPRKTQQLLGLLKGKRMFFKKYKKKLISIIDKLQNVAGKNVESTIQVIAETEKIKSLLYENLQNGELVEMWSQAPIYQYLKKIKKLDKSRIDDVYTQSVIQISIEYFTQLLPIVSSILESLEESLSVLSNREIRKR